MQCFNINRIDDADKRIGKHNYKRPAFRAQVKNVRANGKPDNNGHFKERVALTLKIRITDGAVQNAADNKGQYGNIALRHVVAGKHERSQNAAPPGIGMP